MSDVETVVEAREHDATIASVVRRAMGGVPWSKARELCESGRVTVNGVKAMDSAARVTQGAVVVIRPTAPKKRGGVLDPEALVYVDREIVVVNKPAATLTIPYDDGDRDTLVDQTRALLRRMEKGKREAYDPELGVVHRLDKDTTGVMMFTRSLAAKRHLSQQFRDHSIERRYLALVQGKARDATHDTTLVRDRGDGLRGSWGKFRGAIGEPPEDAQRAVTHVRVLEELEGATLIECKLETGRQHQIRIHLAEAYTMLIGEPVYKREFYATPIAAPRVMLHAFSLGFVHPRTEEEVYFEKDPPDDFVEVYERLKHP
ncbi:MAG: RluA family pseudouridine synthase [Sandaracinaceae bacterium]|jgi:23S rRNA pseudouridine1911/1915/1917 synthase|nr:RluA family pseudouridine synthase [Sandaracinaceae bacterium]